MVVQQRRQLRLAKVHHALKQNEAEWRAARTAQYTTQLLLPQVARCIDDIVHDNYTVPVLESTRKFNDNRTSVKCADGLYRFPDEINVQEQVMYDTSHFVLKSALTQDELKRLQNINSVYAEYMQTGAVRLSALRKALRPEQCSDMIAATNADEHTAEMLYGAGMPVALKEYNKKLQQADFLTYRFEAMPLQGTAKYKFGKAGKIEDRAISLYEDALGRLEEIFTSASGADLAQLHDWMDRVIDFGTGGALNTDIHAMPRVRGSRSAYAQDARLPKLSKRMKRNECALKALLVACCEIAFVFPEVQVDPAVAAAQSQTLKQMMAKLRSVKD